ncbi:cyclin-K-like [Copidosoma floridanum]|uniref:cyclin-K-like n=1 Tax=Copidosoma floridanum TaxID=29053 RepID=UPI0006C99784|nr:cyclin-K-like [Copidosoma floridanum]
MYWYWDKQAIETNTPSIQDGVDHLTEYKFRKEGATFIAQLGSNMDLGYNTLATGVVFFHRFYMFHSFTEFPKYVTAACCLFLAGKVEETPKKCKDIIKIAKNLLSKENFASFGVDPKEEMMTLEKILLQTMKFDFKVQHPYSYLTTYAKCLKGDKIKLQKMVQMAWTFINDSLCTTLSVEWEPEIIAIAVMYLAGKLSKFKVIDWSARKSHHLYWWDSFVEDLNISVLEDICHQILDLYSPLNEKKKLVSDSDGNALEIEAVTTAVTSVGISPSVGSTNYFTTVPSTTLTTNSTSSTATPVVVPKNSQAILPWLPSLMKPDATKTSTTLMINKSTSLPNFNSTHSNSFKIKQEKTPNSDNESPSPNYSVQTLPFNSFMNYQDNQLGDYQLNRSFMNEKNNDLWNHARDEELQKHVYSSNMFQGSIYRNPFSNWGNMFNRENNRRVGPVRNSKRFFKN